MNIKKEWPASAYTAQGDLCVCIAGMDVNGIAKSTWSESDCNPMTLIQAKREGREESMTCTWAELWWGDKFYTFRAGKQEMA
jgi:hypothetical protein|tara:strand:+ start:129 stop:374 length:246 start_codon:yes stop_codon:yes gene_type:complete